METDVVVVGGGVTGAGVALDAAARGLSVVLLEAGDLAVGTSSRSGKTMHGGLRYLEQLNFSLVFGALRERDLTIKTLAPHLVSHEPFLYPLRHQWEKPYVGSGVGLYDAGYVFADEQVSLAVRRRMPFVLSAPKSIASACVGQLASRLQQESPARVQQSGFFHRMSRWLWR